MTRGCRPGAGRCLFFWGGEVPTYWHLVALPQDALDGLPAGTALRHIEVK